MAPDPRVAKAFKAMKAIGISENKVKPVLKKLLKLYEKNWELIEEENYRALADAIFDDEDAKVLEQKKPKIANEENFEEEPLADDEPLRPLKRLRRGQEVPVPTVIRNSSPTFNGTLMRLPKVEEDELPATSSQQQSQDKRKSPQSSAGDVRADPQHVGYKGKEPVLAQVASMENRCIAGRASHAVRIRDPTVEPCAIVSPKRVSNTQALIKPKEEPFTEDMFTSNSPQYEVPIAVIHPDSFSKRDLTAATVSMEEPVEQEPLPSQHLGHENRGNGVLASPSRRTSNCELSNFPDESPTSLEIASSTMGEVKISLSCSSAIGSPNFHMPSLDELRQLMEERCLRSYKIIDPNFSVMNLMKDVCDCFVELATNPSHESQERLRSVAPSLDMSGKPIAQDALLTRGSKENIDLPSGFSSGSVGNQRSADVVLPQIPRPLRSLNGLVDQIGASGEINANGIAESDKEEELKESEFSSSLVLVPRCQLTLDDLRVINDVRDVSKGEEWVEIPWVNEINNECLPSFHYISHNLVFQNACVNVSLSRIGVEDCCSSCFGNCLSSAVACACAHNTGKFVYTSAGLLEEEFLEDCISMTRDPQQQCLMNCRNCPLERLRNEGILEPCKGHLKRNMIKECWSKCGCYRQCGNRVVQRGINCKLQVFFTSDGKGWGLRTLEKLQKGAFVCEFVGEIVTIKELYERNTKNHNCPVLLDAHWVAKGVSKDEETLCLDATFYGNVSRFLNHRCFDANLIEIPVEIETPEHHYYHLAFFTTRDVEALEELTWDYGIDFDDNDHLVKTFQCRCGSKFCRNMKRSSRSKSVPTAR